MSTKHIIQQGENLCSIAKKHKIANWKDIYLHPENATFRKMRPNPNIIMQGDEIVIPEITKRGVTVRTGRNHVFVVKDNAQKFQLQIMDHERKPLAGTKVAVGLESVASPIFTNAKGVVEVLIPANAPSSFTLDIFSDTASTEPSWQYEVQLSALDPSDTVSGVQARLNALGFPAGPVDGLMGRKTRSAIKSYQRTQACLQVNGELSPALCAALQSEYGC